MSLIATVSQCKTTSGGLWGKRAQQLVVRNCTEKYDWKQPNRVLVVQTGESVDQAKVFKAHAVPQGLCANLIHALELLENQQEDGDGLLQNIVIKLGRRSRKGLTDGLRESIKIDNDCALEVGYLNRGRRTFRVRQPKVPEGCPEVTVRESPEELTLRAKEVGTLKAYIKVDHTAKERCGPPLVDADEEATQGPEGECPLENEGSSGCGRRILRSHA